MATWATCSTLNQSSTVWIKWCDNTTASTSSSNDNDQTWTYWNTSTASTSACDDTSTAWNGWVRYQPAYYQPPERTRSAAEVERLQRERDEWREKAAEERKKREAAELRAEELLKANLTEEQRQQYETDRKFHVVSETGKRYEIRAKGLVGNVYEINKGGRPVKRWCAHPSGVPLGDSLLAQKLALEANEAEFLRVANPHPISA